MIYKAIAAKQETKLELRSPAELIVEVAKGKANIGNLKELLEIQERWEAGQAR